MPYKFVYRKIPAMRTPTEADVKAFEQLCDQVGQRAAAKGLTEEQLADLLASHPPTAKDVP
jgi:hypothetical protein